MSSIDLVGVAKELAVEVANGADELKVRSKLKEMNIPLDEAAAVLQVVFDLQKSGDVKVVNDDIWGRDYVKIPPTIDQFMTPKWLGEVSKEIYPAWREIHSHVLRPKSPVSMLVLTGAIGGGKTFNSVIAQAYKMCLMSHLKSPQRYYPGLSEASNIVFGTYSVSLKQGELAAFYEAQKLFKASPYFKTTYKLDENKLYKSLVIRLPNNIIFLAGSQQFHALGLNVFGVIVDEANFRREADKLKGAEDLLHQLQTRLVSRFLDKGGQVPGLIVLISSRDTEQSFLERFIDKARSDVKLKDSIYIVDKPLWEYKRGIQPYVNMSGLTFRIDAGDQANMPKILAPMEEERMGARIITVPVELEETARHLNLSKFLRDICGVSSAGPRRFFYPPQRLIDSCLLPNPATAEAISLSLDDKNRFMDIIDINKLAIRQNSNWVLRNCAGAPRFAHIDLARKNYAGVAICHIEGSRKTISIDENQRAVSIDQPVIVCDFIFRVFCNKDSRIDFGKIRDLFNWLRIYGMQFGLITFDDYQSTDSQNILSAQGFNIGRLSVDRTRKPYDIFYNLVNEGRFMGINHKIFLNEALNLIDDDTENKIVKPEGGTKDCADALCGAIFNAATSSNQVRLEWSKPVFLVNKVVQQKNIYKEVGIKTDEPVMIFDQRNLED